MSRDIHHIAKLNSWNDEPEAPGPRDNPIDEELSMFANTRFYDMDMGRSTDISTTVDELLMQQEKQIQYPQKKPNSDGFYPQPGSSSDYLVQPQPRPELANPALPIDFSDLQEFSLASELPVFNYYEQQQQPAHHYEDVSVLSRPTQPQLYHPHPQPAAAATTSAVEHTLAPRASQLPAPKRAAVEQSVKAEDSSSEDGTVLNRHQAEEDKRKRNTAASARFRIKKKLKEQEMERSTRQMQVRIEDLENKVKQLEMENRWLKNLVVERNEARDMTDLEDLRSRLLGGAEKKLSP